MRRPPPLMLGGFRPYRAAAAVLMDMTTVVIYTQLIMRRIQLNDAKSKLSAVVDHTVRGRPSVIRRHGKPEAVVLGFADWERRLSGEICRGATERQCAHPACDALSDRYQRHLSRRANYGH